MQYQITHKPSFSLLKLRLGPGQSIKSEAGAMVYMSSRMQVETKMGSGFLSALGRKFFGGESFFFNTYTAPAEGGEIGIAPDLPGDIVELDLNGKSIFVQSGSYLASDSGIQVKSKFGRLRSLLGGEGLFLLEVFGTGRVFLSSYGSIVPIRVEGAYTVDTGHIVAFENSLQFSVGKAGGSWKSTFFSGEGLVANFNGQGTIWIQSRVPSGFIGWLTRLLPH
ncbi:TIGR00266 family protein [Leptospira wolffii]|uniref:TIGR00266 family protein n=1 Tax=Leptospira wolffii TaxID=409998 RepID=UPI00108304D5|nr:TIGR00266 family protein [Leptospira wolffii]TGK59985.1 TIGR00266 family protein [Leptospira wolffii]TGK70025.1 TIGR00266 family protein [Leptospira wolffii]TGK75993.1 TIGR00266 family protein [Leptospira wolffii]TGL30244.1 TIGR00266 family protein [Leptospira wolffii]